MSHVREFLFVACSLLLALLLPFGLEVFAAESKVDESGSAASSFNLYWDDGLRLESRQKDLTVKIGGRLHVDAGAIQANDALQDAFPDLTGTSAQVRRFRMELEASFFHRSDLKFEVEYSDQLKIQDAYFQVNKIPFVGQIRAGHFKEPFSLEELASNNNITFMERSLPTSIFAPARNLGLQATERAFDDRLTWSVGLFYDVSDLSLSSGGSSLSAIAGGYDVTTRLTALPWYTDEGRRLLHLGLGYSHKFRTDDEAKLSTRPESYLTEDALASTGNFYMEDADLVSSELALSLGPFSLQAECFQELTTASAEDHFFWGYYVFLSYFLTGENRHYDKKSAVFSTLSPRHPFDPVKGEWGAWQVAFRFSYIDLNDGAVQGGEEQNFTAGLNWYLNKHARLMFNYVHPEVLERASPEIDNGRGEIFQGRFQVFF